MKPKEKFMRRKFGPMLWSGMVALTGICIMFFSTGSSFGKAVARGGTISGKIIADHGVVRAFRVSAKDTDRKITYTVFTHNGSYHVFNLPAGNYEVSALEVGFESPVNRVQLKAGETETADLILKAVAERLEFDFFKGYVKAKPGTPAPDVADFDALFPPGPGRDLWMGRCAGCHGFRDHGVAFIPRSEGDWRALIGNMFKSPMLERGGGFVPGFEPGAISAEDRETITKYLVNSFGMDSKRRDLLVDTPVRDEDELANAVYVSYELPPQRSGGGSNRPSKLSPTIWVAANGPAGPSIVALDLDNLEYPKRFREWMIPKGDAPYSRAPIHELVESKDGRIYWVETDDAVGELDPKTGAIHRYPTTPPHTYNSFLHSLDGDSQGGIWYAGIWGTSPVGRFDSKTKQIQEWNPSPDHKSASYYGTVVDQKDRVWATGVSGNVIVDYDPKSEKWTTFSVPEHRLKGSAGAESASPRRPAVDSKGMIWFTMTGANAIGMLDPNSGKFKMYDLPWRYCFPYDLHADLGDNLWVDIGTGTTVSGLAKFDRKTEKFTFFPYPEMWDHNEKLQMDPRGIFWLGSGRPTRLTSFNPQGNVPTLRSGM